MSSAPLNSPPVYRNGKKVPLTPIISQQEPTEQPNTTQDAFNQANPLNLKNLVNSQRPSIIGMFSDKVSHQVIGVGNPIETPVEAPIKSSEETSIKSPQKQTNAQNTPENPTWLHQLVNKYRVIHTHNGITLFADNKIEIRSSPESLSYTIIVPDQLRYIKIVGSKILVAEKSLYGFSEITYEYHQSEEKNKLDMITLLRFIIFVKMQNSLDKIATIHEKLFNENVDEQLSAIKYTYPILCLYSYASTYEFYLCDASYDHEPCVSIKIDNDIGFTNVTENQRITSRILIHYASYTLYFTCKSRPKKYIIEIMNKLFQAVRNAQDNKHVLDAIGISKRIKIENSIKN